MTASTITQSPTEAAIRAQIVERLGQGYSGVRYVPDPSGSVRSALHGVVHDAGQPVTVAAFNVLDVGYDSEEWGETDEAGQLFADLRPSQARRLRRLMDEAERRAVDRCEALIVDELTTAALAFAAEHPEAPRGEEEAS